MSTLCMSVRNVAGVACCFVSRMMVHVADFNSIIMLEVVIANAPALAAMKAPMRQTAKPHLLFVPWVAELSVIMMWSSESEYISYLCILASYHPWHTIQCTPWWGVTSSQTSTQSVPRAISSVWHIHLLISKAFAIHDRPTLDAYALRLVKLTYVWIVFCGADKQYSLAWAHLRRVLMLGIFWRYRIVIVLIGESLVHSSTTIIASFWILSNWIIWVVDRVRWQSSYSQFWLH